MPNPQMIAALSRIEAAAGRLERALAARPTPPADPALAERHARLRAETAAALARLDRLLDPVGEGNG